MSIEANPCTHEARRIIRRVYFFEVLAVLNAIAAHLVVGHPERVLPLIPTEALFVFQAFGLQLAAGIVGRLIYAAFRRNARQYLSVLRSREWLTDTVRLIFFAAVIVHTYTLLKIAVPLLHPRLFDQELWNVDAVLLLGHSPNVLLLSMFSNRAFLRGIDATYSTLFELSLHFAFAFFLSAPERRLRVAFTNANSLLWAIGAWLYVAIPSLGPAYRFPDIWAPYAAVLPETIGLQHALMYNYRVVAGYARGTVNVLFGIAAFPSMHVAFETLLWLCMRRVWRPAGIIFGVVFLLIFFGSVITGWHYLIDSIAGVALAIPCYWAFFGRVLRLDEHAPD
jgi:hypothetical protein